MRIKNIVVLNCVVVFSFLVILFCVVLIGDDEQNNSSGIEFGMNLDPEVIRYQSMVEKYAREYNIADYVSYLLAIMQVESGGKAVDVMQSSESLGLPPNSLSTEDSIKQGCKYFADLVRQSKEMGCDIYAVVQSYNFGGGYLGYVSNNGKKHSFDLSEAFACQKSGGKKVTYSNPIAIKKNGGWRYGYGNMFYVELVAQYLIVQHFDNETMERVINEALKYDGWPYIYGGSTPATSFDCSGLIQWCYSMAGIQLPRTAQDQYNATQHIPLSQAQPGDLVFFQGTTSGGNYITHVGLYLGGNRMFHAGSSETGIGYADLNSAYYQNHMVCAGRAV